ncbi:fungal cellulose binding domain-containing protein [Phlyctema vagabunda]|uniref:Fungal cellulose binding domain-containing protein n=1 Tax=Phlyctema vagabunda TaxID=108571 RepID=A0ABR4PYY6_9HELO
MVTSINFKASGLLSCSIILLLANVISAASTSRFSTRTTNGTGDHPYRFNSVAVTGGGFITGIIGHPAEPNLLYTRTDIGSSYRWSQEDDKWIPLTDFISESNINWLGTESFALDPTNTNMLYLAQGQYTTSNNSVFLVSEDKGNTFSIYPAPFPMGSNELGRNNGERLAVNPFNPDELYFGTRTQGLWKSTDQAKTWTNVTDFPDAFANGIGIIFVVFDPTHDGTIYVGANVPNGIYFTKDGGATWDVVPGQPLEWTDEVLNFANSTPTSPPLSTGPQPMRASLASNGVLYVTYGDGPGPYGVSYGIVQKFDTNSSTWTDITPGANNSYPLPYTPQAFPRGGYNGLSVAQDDPDTLVVVSLDRDPGPAIDSMYFSRDGGVSWKDVSQLGTPYQTYEDGGFWGHPVREAALKNGTAVPWLSFNNAERWGGYGAPSPNIGQTKFGWWMSAVLIDPNNSDHVMYGTGATIWSTDTISRVDNDWAPSWYVQAQGIEMTAILALISPTEGANLLSGFGDIHGFRHDDLFTPQPMFSEPQFSNLDDLDWAGLHPNVVVKVGSTGYPFIDSCPMGAISTDGGSGWNRFETCAPQTNNSFQTGGTIAVDASGEHLVWSTGGLQRFRNETGPYFSADYGKEWSAPEGLNIGTGNISSDKVQPKTFYAYDSGVWYISEDGGATYNSSNASDIGLPEDTGAIPIVSFKDAGEIWLPLGKEGVYYTKNFGASWTKLGQEGLSTTMFSVGAPAPGSATPALYLWGNTTNVDPVTGLFRSDDNGASWARVNDESHQYGGPRIVQGDPRVYGRVYQGYFGRGIIYADIDTESNHTSGVRPGTYGI